MIRNFTKISLTFVFVLMTCLAWSQDSDFRLKAGGNFSNIYGDEVEDNQWKIGYHFGLGFHEKLGNNTSAEINLFYSQMGNIDESNNDAVLKINYLTASALFKYHISKLFVGAGPQFGLLSSAEYDDFEVEDGLQQADTSVIFGLGYDYSDDIDISVRYTRSLFSVFKEGEIGNHGLMLTVGYKLF